MWHAVRTGLGSVREDKTPPLCGGRKETGRKDVGEERNMKRSRRKKGAQGERTAGGLGGDPGPPSSPAHWRSSWPVLSVVTAWFPGPASEAPPSLPPSPHLHLISSLSFPASTILASSQTLGLFLKENRRSSRSSVGSACRSLLLLVLLWLEAPGVAVGHWIVPVICCLPPSTW